jgi:ABC-type sugar transport system permease subunit
MGYAAAISWLLFLVIAVFSIIQFRLMRETSTPRPSSGKRRRGV